MTESAFKWCFIGTGTLARPVAREIIDSGRHLVSAVVSRKIENAARFAAEFGGKVYEDPREAMAQADGVYIVTPHPSHATYVKTAIETGKPVLCEKPFTVRARETRELFHLAREKGVYIVEGMWTWFNPVALQVREWVTSGRIGTVEQVTTDMRVNVTHYAPRLTDPQLAGGAILDSGVYPITYLYRLFGKPVAVRCNGEIIGGVDLDDEIDLTFANGQTHHISLSIREDARKQYIRITGTEAEVFVDNFHFADHADLLAKDGTLIQRFEGKTTMLNEFDRVAEEIRQGKTESAIVPPQATIDVMEIMDECLNQIGLVYPFE